MIYFIGRIKLPISYRDEKDNDALKQDKMIKSDGLQQHSKA
jgi:hypothetical protein